MRWQTYLVVVSVLAFFIAVPASAGLQVTAFPEWIIANGSSSSTITLNLTNNTGEPIKGAYIEFSVNSTLGSISPKLTITGEDGIATAMFESKTLAGTAEIFVSVNTSTPEGFPIVNIDHDTPYTIQQLNYPDSAVRGSATVGEIRNISLRMQDIHGNIVDDRNKPENITFTRITEDETWFWNRTASNFSNKSINIENGPDGWVRADLLLNTSPGETRVQIKPSYLADRTILIERVADGEPRYIYAVRRDPTVPFVPANGEEYFVITYQLFDQYWNVLNNRIIELNSTNPKGPWNPNIITTYNGLAAAKYGPFNITDISPLPYTTNLVATSVDNHSVKSILPAEFYDPNPYTLILSVNPKNLPSLDVNDTSEAILTGTVIDCRGRGVKDQTIDFSVLSSNYSLASPTVLSDPYITATSSTTGDGGYAYVTFIPGRFNESRPVTGTCNITGRWNGITKIVDPVWKNYGYLRVTTYSDYNPSTNLSVNQMVNLSVEVYADGPMFTSLPIDLILNLDRGAKMLLDTYGAGSSGPVHDKMVYVYEYSGVLLEQLTECSEDEQCDRAGVVSFGPGENSINWPGKTPGLDNDKTDDSTYKDTWYPTPYTGYEDWATIDTGLMYDFDPLVKNTVNSTIPFGDPWKGWEENVPMRYGLYKAINEMIGLGESDPRPNAIRAIVLCSDTEWNDWGDPTAGWDGTSVNTAHAVPITKKAPWELNDGGLSSWTPFDRFGEYVNETMTAVPAGISDDRQNMANYAKAHDIIIYTVAYPEKDTNIETSRENVLRYLASATGGMYFEARSGTDLRNIFENISRDLRQRASVNTTANFDFSKIRLNADPNNLTAGYEVFDYVYTNDSTLIQKWYNIPDATDNPQYSIEHLDHTGEWNATQKLTFDLGTMYVGDRWLVNFTLMAKKVAAAELFEFSNISSDSGDISVPEAVIVVEPARYGDEPTKELDVTLDVSPSMNAVYSISYSGEKKVHAKLYYRKSGDVMGDWKQYASREYRCEGHTCMGFLDEKQLSRWLIGAGQYMFKIEAWADDAPLDIAEDGPITVGGKYFIWLR